MRPFRLLLLFAVLLFTAACASTYLQRMQSLQRRQQAAEAVCVAARAQKDPTHKALCTRAALCSQALDQAAHSVDRARQLAVRVQQAKDGEPGAVAPSAAVIAQAEREATEAERTADRACAPGLPLPPGPDGGPPAAAPAPPAAPSPPAPPPAPAPPGPGPPPAAPPPDLGPTTPVRREDIAHD